MKRAIDWRCPFTAKNAKFAKKNLKALRSCPKNTGAMCGLRGSKKIHPKSGYRKTLSGEEDK
jgi:hypothetical protein